MCQSFQNLYCTTLFCVLFFLSCTLIVGSKKCHSLYENSKYYLATKTPYSYVANYDDDPVVIDGK